MIELPLAWPEDVEEIPVTITPRLVVREYVSDTQASINKIRRATYIGVVSPDNDQLKTKEVWNTPLPFYERRVKFALWSAGRLIDKLSDN